MPANPDRHTRRQALAAGSALVLGAVAPSRAQAWPSKPVRLTVAYPPGGISDEISRALAEGLAARLGVPVLVDHRPGAGGSLAMEHLARSAPDGHALCFSAITPLTLSPLLGHQRFDPAAEIEPLISVMQTPILVVGTPALMGDTWEALVAQARLRPGAVRWASSGIGTTGHLVLEQVRRASGLDIAHIPYKGGGEQIQHALGGQFEVLSTNLAPAQVNLVQAGRLKALALGAPARLQVLPDVRTLAELGFPAANLGSVFGLFAPARTPAAILERLNAELNGVLGSAALRQKLATVNSVPTGGSRQAFTALIAREAEAQRNAHRDGRLKQS